MNEEISYSENDTLVQDENIDPFQQWILDHPTVIDEVLVRPQLDLTYKKENMDYYLDPRKWLNGRNIARAINSGYINTSEILGWEPSRMKYNPDFYGNRRAYWRAKQNARHNKRKLRKAMEYAGSDQKSASDRHFFRHQLPLAVGAATLGPIIVPPVAATAAYGLYTAPTWVPWLASNVVLPWLAGETLNEVTRKVSDGYYDSVGDFVYRSTPLKDWTKDTWLETPTKFAADMTNPGYWAPYSKISKSLFHSIPNWIEGKAYGSAGNLVGRQLFGNPTPKAFAAAENLTNMVPSQYRYDFYKGVQAGNESAAKLVEPAQWFTRNDGPMSNNALYSTIFPVNKFTTSIYKTVKNIPNRLKTQLAFSRTNLKNIDKKNIERFTYEKFLNKNITTPRSHDGDGNLLEPGYKIYDYWEAPRSLVHVNKNVPGYNNGYGGEKHKQIIKDGTLHRTTYPVNMLRYTERPLPEKYIYWFANRPYYSGNPETQSNFIIKKYNPSTDIVVSKNNHLNYIDEIVSENDIPIDQLEGYYYDPAIKTFMINKYHDPSLNKQDIGLEGQYNYEDFLPEGAYWKIKQHNILKDKLEEFGKLYDYPVYTGDKMSTEDLINQSKHLLRRHNTFVRGVVDPIKTDLERSNEVFYLTSPEARKRYAAITPWNDTSGVWASPMSNALNYGGDDTYFIRRTLDFSGDPITWFDKNNWVLHPNSGQVSGVKAVWEHVYPYKPIGLTTANEVLIYDPLHIVRKWNGIEDVNRSTTKNYLVPTTDFVDVRYESILHDDPSDILNILKKLNWNLNKKEGE